MPKNLSTPSASFTPQLRINARGGSTGTSAGTVAIIASAISAVFGFAFLLIIGAQIAGQSSLYGSLSASNITKITTNVGNAVVAGSGFMQLLYLGAGVALAAALIFLGVGVFQRKGG